MIPHDLKFTKTHEWLRVKEGTDIVVVGTSDFAVQQFGDIVFIELPSAGESVTSKAPFGVIESVKAAVELYSPIDGEVAESNQLLTDDFEALSNDPYGEGWMIKIKATDLKQLDELMSATDYESYIQNEECQH